MFEADLHIFEFQMFFFLSLLFPFTFFHLRICGKSSKKFSYAVTFLSPLSTRFFFWKKIEEFFILQMEKKYKFHIYFRFEIEMYTEKGFFSFLPFFLCLIRVMLEFTNLNKAFSPQMKQEKL